MAIVMNPLFQDIIISHTKKFKSIGLGCVDISISMQASKIMNSDYGYICIQ